MKISIKTSLIIHHLEKNELLSVISGELAKQEIKNISSEDGKINFEFKKTTFGEMVYKSDIPDEGNFVIGYAAADIGSLDVLYTASIIITTELLIMIGLLLLGVLIDHSFFFGFLLFSLQEVYRFTEFRKGIKKIKENILLGSKQRKDLSEKSLFS